MLSVPEGRKVRFSKRERKETGSKKERRKYEEVFPGPPLFQVAQKMDASSPKQDKIALYYADGEAYTLGVNRAYEKLTEISQRQVYGKNLRELENKFFKPSVSLQVLKEKRVVTIPQQLLTLEKKLVVTGNPIFNEKGEIILVVTVVKPFSLLLEESVGNKKDDVKTVNRLGNMVVKSPLMMQVVNRAVRIAGVDANVLITGESGTGKELIARTIHELSARKNAPFISVNAASLPETLFEAELFGYIAGAFTGASARGSKGLVKAAEGGTLFLDEISEVPLSVQAKLLRLLENKEYIPVGSSRVERADVRLIAACNKNLAEQVRKGRFREDLFYRLNVLNIYIPPLRDRIEDIEALSCHFLNELNCRLGTRKYITESAVQILKQNCWTGNVRELKNLLARLVLLYDDNVISPELIERELSAVSGEVERGGVSEYRTLEGAVARFEKDLIQETIKKCGSIEKGAQMLGIHRTTLLRKMRKYGIIW